MGKLLCLGKDQKTNLCRYIFQFFFWRTYDQQEIDLIETRDQQLKAFEFKWGKKITKTPKAFVSKSNGVAPSDTVAKFCSDAVAKYPHLNRNPHFPHQNSGVHVF